MRREEKSGNVGSELDLRRESTRGDRRRPWLAWLITLPVFLLSFLCCGQLALVGPDGIGRLGCGHPAGGESL